jgi:hypothetical protein
VGLGLSGEDTKVDERERDGGLEVVVGGGWSGDWAVAGTGASSGGVSGIWKGSAREDPLGEGIGVVDRDGSYGTDSKGLVLTSDDDNIVRVG